MATFNRENPTQRKMRIKITIVYDNTTTSEEFTSDWGWSCYIETGETNILFDTGGNGRILLNNLKALGISPESVHDVFVSHPDFDHIGGLSAFLNSNQKAVVHVPISFRGIRYPNKVIYHDKPAEIHTGIHTTGELGNREQSLALRTQKGLVLVIGCGHPGVENIMRAASQFGKVYGVIGGLHGFDNFEIIEATGIICPAHCTKHSRQIKSLFPHRCVDGGVGRVIVI